jgi:tryptophanyl-tRNA synthetase
MYRQISFCRVSFYFCCMSNSTKRILTGIQSTNRPHLGNILGAIRPLIKLSEEPGIEAFAFIADLHSLTTVHDAEFRKESVRAVAATWLACGFDSNKNFLYLQSQIPEITELTWYLSCFTPYPMLANAHSFKDKSDRVNSVNAGLFTYPVLMAADILGYDANLVPVGKDQLQHLEITRDLAGSFNHQFGETFVVPEAYTTEHKIIPGTDGQKMSKSYNNFIDVFLPEKELKKAIGRIITDSTPLEMPKNPDTCNVFNLYSVLSTAAQKDALKEKYLAGNFGYGHAKQELLGLILEEFAREREAFNEWMNDPVSLESELSKGADKVRPILQNVLVRVRGVLGYS